MVNSDQNAHQIIIDFCNWPPIYVKFQNSKGEQYATKELLRLQKRFAEEIIDGIAKQKAEQPKLDPPDIPTFHDNCKCELLSLARFFLFITDAFGGSNF